MDTGRRGTGGSISALRKWHLPTLAATGLMLAKWFGTLCLRWGERAGVAGLWLTAILTDPHVRDTLANT